MADDDFLSAMIQRAQGPSNYVSTPSSAPAATAIAEPPSTPPQATSTAAQPAPPTAPAQAERSGPHPLMFLIPGFAAGYFQTKAHIALQNRLRGDEAIRQGLVQAAEEGNLDLLNSEAGQQALKKLFGKEGAASLYTSAQINAARNKLLGQPGMSATQALTMPLPSGSRGAGPSTGATETAPTPAPGAPTGETDMLGAMIRAAQGPSEYVSAPPPAAPAGPAPAATRPAPAVPAPTTQAPQTYDQHVQALVDAGRPQGLAERNTATFRMGRMTMTETGETPDQRARRVIAAAQQNDAPLPAVYDALNAHGLPVPQNMAYFDQRATRTYQANLRTLADAGLTPQQAQRAAARMTFAQEHYLPSDLRQFYPVGDVEAQRDALSIATSKLDSGIPAPAVITQMRRGGAPLTAEQEATFKREAAGREYQRVMQAGGDQQTAARLAIASVGGDPNAVPTEILSQAYPKPQVSEATGEVLAARGGSPFKPGDVAAARVERLKTDVIQAGERAGAEERARQGVPQRLAPGEQEQAGSFINSLKLAQTIATQFKPEYVGVQNRGVSLLPLGQWTGTKAGGIGGLREKLGTMGAEEIAFRANLSQLIIEGAFALGKSRIESNQNVSAFERVTGPVPHLDDASPELFLSKLKEFVDRVNQRYDTFRQVTGSQGMRSTPGVPSVTIPKSAPAAPSAGGAAPSPVLRPRPDGKYEYVAPEAR